MNSQTHKWWTFLPVWIVITLFAMAELVFNYGAFYPVVIQGAMAFFAVGTMVDRYRIARLKDRLEVYERT